MISRQLKYYRKNKERLSEESKQKYREKLGRSVRVKMSEEEKRAKRREYYLNNQEKLKEYRQLNSSKAKDYMKDWYESNREDQLEYKKNYAKETRPDYNARDAKRRAAKLKQTPKWADLEAIKEFYRNCPAGYHVDHIVPLQGKNVRGLHVLENLQYLPASENVKKNNKFNG